MTLILGFDPTPIGWFALGSITILGWLSLLVVVRLLSKDVYTRIGNLDVAASLLLLLVSLSISAVLLLTSLGLV